MCDHVGFEVECPDEGDEDVLASQVDCDVEMEVEGGEERTY